MQDVLRDSMSHALVRAFRDVNRRFGRALRPLGISAEQAHILLILWIHGPLTVGQLQDAVSLSGPTLSGALQRLEHAHQVRGRTMPQDRRAWLIEAVPWSARRRARLIATLQEVEDAYLADLSRAERKQLHRLLVRLVPDTDSSRSRPDHGTVL